METDMAKIINAIMKSMPCDMCPYPCKAKEKSSPVNCSHHWFMVLSYMTKEPWEIVNDKLFDIFSKNDK